MNGQLNPSLKKVLFAGLLAGSLDILAAFIDAGVTSHVGPGQVLKFIAQSAFGPGLEIPAYAKMLIGLAIHFFIAMSYSFFFFLIYPLLKQAIRSNIVIGILYGFFVWATMRFLVLPNLSKIQFGPFTWREAVKPALILMAAIGIPLTYLMNKYVFRFK